MATLILAAALPAQGNTVNPQAIFMPPYLYLLRPEYNLLKVAGLVANIQKKPK